jgi:GNAT superfamily N-acetyltransferase
MYIAIPWEFLPIAKLVWRLTGPFFLRLSWHVPSSLLECDYHHVLRFKLNETEKVDERIGRVSLVCRSDIRALADINGESEILLAKELDCGDIGFIMRDACGQAMGYIWLSCSSEAGTKLYQENSKYRLKLASNSAWQYASFVKPDCRRKGVWRTLCESVKTYAIQHDINTIFCAVQYNNHVSLSAHYAYGYQRVCGCFCLKVMRFRLIVSEYDNSTQ